jgi:glycosyltransferase involved in cell wall biosynthesis
MRVLGGAGSFDHIAMHIFLLTQYFPPESGASQNRLGDLAERLVQFGHDVTVLTAFPNYPEGRIFQGYRGHLLKTETWRGMRVIRTWVYATKSQHTIPRLLNYCSFTFLACLFGPFLVGSRDILVVDSPPLFLGLAGMLVTQLKRAKLVLNVADLWPESAVALGVISDHILIRILTAFEESLYSHSALITAQTKGIVASIQRRTAGIPVQLLTNGVTPQFLKQTAHAALEREQTRKQFGWDGRFVVGYAGRHGVAQGLDIVLRASPLISGNPNILFALFGDGPDKPRLEKVAAANDLHNVRFYPQEPVARVPHILTAMDAILVPLCRQELFKGALPSKLFDAMGAGKPVIAAAEGEARAIVEESGGGTCVEPENSYDLASAIMKLVRDPAAREIMGSNARSYVLHHYNRENVARKFEGLLQDLAQ